MNHWTYPWCTFTKKSVGWNEIINVTAFKLYYDCWLSIYVLKTKLNRFKWNGIIFNKYNKTKVFVSKQVASSPTFILLVFFCNFIVSWRHTFFSDRHLTVARSSSYWVWKWHGRIEMNKWFLSLSLTSWINKSANHVMIDRHSATLSGSPLGRSSRKCWLRMMWPGYIPDTHMFVQRLSTYTHIL